MAGSPLLVDMCAALITELVRFNPAAVIKLYLTGVFYFAMAYAGSNWKCICRLLYDTHLRQVCVRACGRMHFPIHRAPAAELPR